MFASILVLAAAASAHSPAAKSRWTVIEQSAGAEGAKALIATKRAEAGVPKDAGVPILGLVCDSRGFYLAVRWPTALVPAYTDNRRVPISWKLDDKPAQRESWGARGNSAFKSGAEGVRWLHGLVGAKRLTVAVADKKDRGAATFDLSGLTAVDTKLQQSACASPNPG